ncbi:MAG: serine hydrolase [Spirochaetes bacterium]|nr:serine hydrolase [Spirochaetota bacterium]
MKKKLLYGIALVVLAALGYGIYYIDSALVIGNGYAAKYVCSQVFIDGRDPSYVFQKEVRPTNVLFSLVGVDVDYANKSVTGKGLGFRRPITAVYRDGLGCTLAVDTTREELMTQAAGLMTRKTPDAESPWPGGERVTISIPANVDGAKIAAALDEIFTEPADGPPNNTQAAVVVYRGTIIAERYGQGYTPSMPILGWSMTKSVINALVGILVRLGLIDIAAPAPVAAWHTPGDPRGAITLDQLLRMSSGLEFVEIYGPHQDVTDMLYASKSMSDFASAKRLKTRPDGEWYYSSGTANIVARIIRDLSGGTLAGTYAFARRELFDKLGMCSALIEPDASGTPVGSSYMFATPRDWARIGLLFLNDGVWNGQRILPEGWVKYSVTPTPLAPKGEYGAHLWLNAGAKGNPSDRTYPSLPTDMYYMSGYNGQIVAMFPSKQLVVVRMGVTHDEDWGEERFLKSVYDSIR